MKATLLFFAVLFSFSVFAGDKYICREINGDQYSPKKMILTQVGEDKMKEGKFYPFKLEIFQGNTGKSLASLAVNVRLEDVMVKFTNTANKVSGIIFLDEMEASYVKIGKDHLSFDCN